MTVSATGVRLWTLETDGVRDPLPSAFWAVLDAGERARARTLVRESDRRAFVCAHVLRRALLAETCGRAAADWRFSHRAGEKPRVLTPPPGTDPECNITHTAGLVAAVVADGRAVGVDAEALRPAAAVDPGLARLVCTPRERADLADLEPAPEAWWPAFLRLWTCKEAFAKAAGIGLSLPLTAVDVTADGRFAFDPMGPPVGRADDWCLWTPRPETPHLLAVVCAARSADGRRVPPRLRHEPQRWSDLLV